MQFITRPDTTDQKVFEEVITRNVYEHKKIGFFLRDCPVWLDLGGNIGTFCCKASSQGCKVVSFEPEEDNYRLLCENVALNKSNVTTVQACVVASDAKEVELFLCKGDYNKYRHTIFKKRGRHSVKLPAVNFKQTLTRYRPQGVKIDIEGAEIAILESMTPEEWILSSVTHIVFEYSFDIDPSIQRFKRIIESLKKAFPVVHHRSINWELEKWEYFPAAVIVYAKK